MITSLPGESNPAYRHGHSCRGNLTPTYYSWANMKRRCNDPHNAKYPKYGGRGITVCERWNDFSEFLSDMGEKPTGLTLHRINNDGSYEPNNCTWADVRTQSLNKSTNRILEFKGLVATTKEWSERLGLSHVALRMRLHRGWSAAEALGRPLRKW